MYYKKSKDLEYVQGFNNGLYYLKIKIKIIIISYY